MPLTGLNHGRWHVSGDYLLDRRGTCAALVIARPNPLRRNIVAQSLKALEVKVGKGGVGLLGTVRCGSLGAPGFFMRAAPVVVQISLGPFSPACHLSSPLLFAGT